MCVQKTVVMALVAEDGGNVAASPLFSNGEEKGISPCCRKAHALSKLSKLSKHSKHSLGLSFGGTKVF